MLSAGVVALGILAAGAWVWFWLGRDEPPAGLPAPAVTLVAGDGVAAFRDGAAHRVSFSEPYGIATASDGTIYVADAGSAQRIRRIAPDGTVVTIAGGEPGYRDGPGPDARFDTPSGLALDHEGGILVADTGNHVIRRIGPDGMVTTVAGDGTAGLLDGPARQARFRGPTGVAVDAAGRIIVADTYNDRIRAIEPSGTVVTIAGSGQPGWVDGPVDAAAFDTPAAVAVDAASNIYVADFGNVAIRRISPSQAVETLPHDGLLRPVSIAVSSTGAVYAGGHDRLIAILPDGATRLVAGGVPGFADGLGAAARFRGIAGVAVAPSGALVLADRLNALVRRVDFDLRPEPPLPSPPGLRPRFDAVAFASLPLLWPFAPQAGPYEVTATFGEPRGGGATDSRLHAGLDISGPEGREVRAVRDGVVSTLEGVSAFGTISEAVSVGPVTYVHLRVGRDRAGRLLDPSRFIPVRDDTGRLTRLRVARGTRFRTGDLIGTLNAFNHAHLNIGWPGEEENPLQFRLPLLRDTTPPVITAGGIRLLAEDGRALSRRQRGRLVVDAERVEIVVDAWDQVDGNLARRRLGLYSLGYQILAADGSAVPGFETPRETLVFDRVPASAAAPLVFASGSGIPGWGMRSSRFLYRVTNTFRGGLARLGYWDAAALPAGDYVVRIHAADFAGNVAVRNRDLPITIER